jgi:glycosyltransferase involved in cell wall biosynthesis
VEPNLFVANPLVLPLPGVSIVDRLNAGILTAWLRRLCNRHRLERPILWTFLPHVSRLIGRLGDQMVIYHCVDEYSAFSGVRRKTLVRMEQAHIILTSSEQLCKERRSLNTNTHYVAHGVDVAHFGRALDPTMIVPKELHGLRRPVVGFFGLLAEWVDLALVRQLALARPTWSIALVGKAGTDLAPLERLPNVYLLGQKPYSDLPGYCRGFDVGIIPFRMNELTVRANPLKLREYLAAGLPVVSTPLPEVARYKDLVHLADGLEAFIAGIEAALGERSEATARHRAEAMRGEGWEVRVEEISALLESTPRAAEPAAAGH